MSESMLSNPPHRSAAKTHILDSLAYLVAPSEKNKGVAIGAVYSSSQAPVKLLVAANHDVPPEVSEHLRDILARLVSIRALVADTLPPSSSSRRYVQNLMHNNSPASGESEKEVKDRLLELETAIVTYSLPKIKQCFLKNNRYQNFLNFYEALRGDRPSQQTVDDHPDPDADAKAQLLRLIQTSPHLSTLDKITALTRVLLRFFFVYIDPTQLRSSPSFPEGPACNLGKEGHRRSALSLQSIHTL